MTRYPCKANCGGTSSHPDRTCLICYRELQTPWQGYDCLEKCGAKTHKKGSRCRPCHGKFVSAKYQALQPMLNGQRGFYCSNGCGTVVARHGRCRSCLKTNTCVDCQASVLRQSVRCASCQMKFVRTADSPKSLRTRPVSRPVQSAPQPTYPCIGECGAQMKQQNVRCLHCRKLLQNVIAATSDLKQRRKRAIKSVQSGECKALMEFGAEIYIMSYLCKNPLCGKPIIMKGMCFACATGQPYTIPIRPVIILKQDTEPVAA
jgi:hypothetical protein